MNEIVSVLLVGAYGLLGGYIRKEFEKENLQTLGMNPKNDYKTDLSKDVPQIRKQYDLVIFNAGVIDEKYALSKNSAFTKNLICGLNIYPPKYMVYISSLSVYGLEYGEDIDESYPLNPTTDYGRSKMFAEQELQRWCNEKGTILTILRPAMIFGNGVHGKAKEMFDAIIQGRYFHITENQARRSIVMADDVAKAVRLLYDKGGIYNVTDGYNPTIIELADSMAANVYTNKRIMSCPLKWLKIAAKIGDTITPLGRLLNTEKLKILTSTLIFSNKKLTDMTNMKFYKTTDVIARRSIDYPYEYKD